MKYYVCGGGGAGTFAYFILSSTETMLLVFHFSKQSRRALERFKNQTVAGIEEKTRYLGQENQEKASCVSRPAILLQRQHFVLVEQQGERVYIATTTGP